MTTRLKKRIAVLLVAFAVVLAAVAWVGRRQALGELRATAARSATKNVANRTPLTLPRPPADGAIEASASEGARSINATTPAQTGLPPPGGFPIDVLQEMWELALLAPRQISARALTPENWFITGVLTRGTEQVVMVQRDSDPKPIFRKVGDELPGGARIAWVGPNAIGLVTPKSERIALPLGEQ